MPEITPSTNTMDIQHFEKNFHYTDRELLLVIRKIGKLATFCERIKDEGSYIHITSARRSTKKERDQVKVSIQVQLPGKVLRATSRRFDVLEAVDRCIEKLEAQVKKYKELSTGRGRSRKGSQS